MNAYAVGLLRDVKFGAGIVAYLENIDATLRPFGGRFIVHGDAGKVVEGQPERQLVIIEFPSFESACAWYESAEYQRILPLRTQNSDSQVVLLRGVDPAHAATDILDA